MDRVQPSLGRILGNGDDQNNSRVIPTYLEVSKKVPNVKYCPTLKVRKKKITKFKDYNYNSCFWTFLVGSGQQA